MRFNIKKMRACREAANKKQWQVAELLGVKRTAFTEKEKYPERLTVVELQQIAEFYGVDLAEFFDGAEHLHGGTPMDEDLLERLLIATREIEQLKMLLDLHGIDHKLKKKKKHPQVIRIEPELQCDQSVAWVETCGNVNYFRHGPAFKTVIPPDQIMGKSFREVTLKRDFEIFLGMIRHAAQNRQDLITKLPVRYNGNSATRTIRIRPATKHAVILYSK